MKKAPDTKISATILEFGKSIIAELPEDFSEEQFRAVLTIVITAWNAIVLDSWNNDNKYETEAISVLANAPRKAQIEMKRLLTRKKKKFGSDPRAVGHHWITEKNGELVFGCDARIEGKDGPTAGVVH